MALAGITYSMMVCSSFSRAQKRVIEMGFFDDINTYIMISGGVQSNEIIFTSMRSNASLQVNFVLLLLLLLGTFVEYINIEATKALEHHPCRPPRPLTTSEAAAGLRGHYQPQRPLLT